MRDSFDYLIHLVRCAIHDHAPSELFDGAVFDSVYKYGTAHDIANIAAYSIEKLESGPDVDLAKKFETKKNGAIFRDMNQDFARDELVQIFDEQGIPWVEVQGTVIKQLYPRREYRTMSDIDIIVPKAELSRVMCILEGLGYECSTFRDFDVNAYRTPDIHFEIHTAFFSDHPDYEAVMPDPFGDGLNKDETLYLYNVLHTAKHYFMAGCGIRRVLDMYYLNKKYSTAAKSDAVREAFDKLGITSFADDMSELAECWFGETEKEVPERLLEMAETIKHSGIHGTKKQKIRSDIEKEKAAGHGGVKVRYVLRRLFPEKWVMEENYPMLKRYMFLYPFCIVHRAAVAVFSKRCKVKEELKNLMDSDK